MNDKEQEFEQRVRTALDADLNALDTGTRSRLAMARAAAFEQQSFLARWFSVDNWMPLTAVAASLMLAVSLFVLRPAADSPVQVAQADTDVALEVMLGDEAQDSVSDPDFFVAMDAMLLIDDEEEKNAG